MSLIVAIKKDNTVYFGADTRITINMNSIKSSLNNDENKIQKIGSCYVGFAGNCNNASLLQKHPEWFQLNGKRLTKKYIVQKLLTNVYKLYKEMEIDYDRGVDEFPDFDCSILLSDGKKLFKIDRDLEVYELAEFGAIGIGALYAASIYLNMDDKFSPNEKILRILRQSTYRYKGIGNPYILINANDNTFELVEV